MEVLLGLVVLLTLSTNIDTFIEAGLGNCELEPHSTVLSARFLNINLPVIKVMHWGFHFGS